MDTEQDFEGTSTHRAPFMSPVYDCLAWELITKYWRLSTIILVVGYQTVEVDY